MSYRFDAFISYRHVEPDRKWAKWLHRGLETFRTPRGLISMGYPQRIRRVFRDEEELAASSDLSADIEEALAQSQFLIVVCSPNTPASQWVNEEVLRFRELGREKNVLALLIDGEPTEAFPKSLCEIRRSLTDGNGGEVEQIEEVEPLAADVRPRPDVGHRYVRRMALLRCAAALLGCRFDDLRQRDHQRRQRRLAVTALAAVVLASVLAALTLFAFTQREIAEERAIQAQRRLAQSLMSQGDAQAASYAYRAARSSYLEAIGVLDSLGSPTLNAKLGLWDSLRRSPPPLVLLPQEQVITDAVYLSGDRVLAGSLDGLDLWDVRRQVLLRKVVSEEVECVAVSPDETRIVTGGRHSDDAVLWDLESGKELARFVVGQPVLDVAFSPDGKQVLTGGQHGLAAIWDAGTGQQAASVTHFPALHALAWLPNGQILTAGVPTRTAGSARPERGLEAVIDQINEATATVAKDALKRIEEGADISELDLRIELHRVLLWDVASATPFRRLAGRGNADDVAVTPNGQLALVAVDEQVELWDLRRGELLFAAPTGQETSGVAISPDGRRGLSVGNAGFLVEWDLPGRRRARTVDVDDEGHRGVSFDPSGRLALLHGAGPLAVVDLEASPEARRFGGNPTAIQDIAFSPDGRLAVSATDQRILVVWNVETGHELRALSGHDHGANRLAFLPDGRRLVTAGSDGVVRLWDVEQGAEIKTFASQTRLEGVEALAVSPSGRYVLTGHWNHEVVLWDVYEAREVRAMAGYTVDPWSLTFIDDQRAAVGYSDGSIGIWDLATGHEQRTLFGGHWPYALAARPDGRLLAGDSSDDVWCWDASTGELLARMNGHEDTVRAVAFLSDQLAVSVAEDRRVIVWDLERHVPVRKLELDPDEYSGRIALGLAPGPRIVVGNYDADRDFIHVWDVERANRAWRPPGDASGLGAWYAARGNWTWAARSLAEANEPDPELQAMIEAALLGPQGLADGSGTPEEQSLGLASSASYVMRLLDAADRGRAAPPEAFVADANELLEAGNAADALPYYERALRAHAEWLQSPDTWGEDLTEYLATQRQKVMFGRSRAHVALEHYAEALDDAQSLVRERPSEARYRLQLARVHEGLGAPADAQREVNEALRLAPEDYHTYSWLAAYHERQGDQDAALKAQDRAVELDPSVSSYEDRAALKERFALYESAIADVTHALAIEESAARYAWRARLRTSAGALQEALADWDRVEILEPSMPWLRYYRAEVRMALGDLDGAAADLAAANEDERSHVVSLSLLGRLLLHKQSWSEAEAVLTRAIEIAPDQMWSYYSRAVAREQLRDISGALTDLDRAQKLDPNEVKIYLFRGYLTLIERAEPKSALADFDAAIHLQPESVTAHHNRGAALRQLGRLEEALVALNRAFELGSDSPRTYYHRGLTLRALGRDEEARDDLKTYLRLAPDAPEREQLEPYLGLSEDLNP